MKKILIAILAMMVLSSPVANAQKKSKAPVEPIEQPQNLYRPSIMVIPYVTGDEDLRTVLEADVNKRIVLNTIRECFDKMGYTTIDFVARLKAISNNEVFTSGTQKEFKNAIIESSGSDVYVEAEIHAAGGNVRILLTAYDTSTGASLSNVVGESGSFPGFNDVAKLGQTAIEICQADFLKTLQIKFNQTTVEGRPIMLNINVAEGASKTLEDEVGSDGNLLSDEIELWMDNHTVGSNYHIQGTTATQMIFDEVRIPVADPQTGKSYNISRFGLDFFKFMKSLGISITRNVKGNTLYIEIK